MALPRNPERCTPRYRRSAPMIRKHITYANVTATLALVLAAGTGAVYAAGEIGSRDLDNNSVRTQDLKDRQAVTREDVRRDTLGSSEIDERDLVAARVVRIDGKESGNCDPANGEWGDCVSQGINLDAPSRLLVTATGGFYSEGGPALAECELRIDGQDASLSEGPGEATSDNTDVAATDGFARTLVTGSIPAGSHTVGFGMSTNRWRRCANSLAHDRRDRAVDRLTSATARSA